KIVDTAQRTIFTGPQGLTPGQELTFFYPSTEWSMDQPFDCDCRSQDCLGRISGARFLNPNELKGRWINLHILEMFRDSEKIRLSSDSCAPDP
ncbi:Bgt-4417-2, partial [Blumeria graminis f. sp. tritici]